LIEVKAERICSALQKGRALQRTTGEQGMPTFQVRFLKAVSDDTGHERKVCQRALEVEADCWAGALSAAREQLGRAESTPDWMRHADAIELARKIHRELAGVAQAAELA